MKPQACGNKLFIHSARKYRFRMKPQLMNQIRHRLTKKTIDMP
jgi:hypothetical protein